MWTNPGEIENGEDDDNNGVVDDIHGIKVDKGEVSGDPNDTNGHGTGVAGIIGAVGNNAKGTVGVAWQVQIMACKYPGLQVGYVADAIACISYAIDKGAHIMNASWFVVPGYSPYSLDVAIRTGGNHGIIFVAAAGNFSLNNDLDQLFTVYPASYKHDNIISVAATTKDDDLTSYSNTGLVRVDLAAPGGENDILTTDNASDSAYTDVFEGTSAAAPHVAGVLALMKAQYPHDSYLQLINRLLSSVDPLQALAGKCPVVTDLGAPIADGDMVMRWITEDYSHYAYRNGLWIGDNGDEASEPVISIGESIWLVKPADWYHEHGLAKRGKNGRLVSR